MGITDVVLVNPVDYLVDETFRLGWGSELLIRSLKVTNTLEEALEGCEIIVGTTHRRRENQVPLFSPKELMTELAPKRTSKIAIVFGRESNGLSNSELSLCNYHSTIPSAVEYPAMNLSQAVMVYAYELFQSQNQAVPNFHYTWDLATHSDQERLYSLIRESVETLPFKTRRGSDAFVRLFRRVLGRTQLERRDVRVLYKLFGLIIKK